MAALPPTPPTPRARKVQAEGDELHAPSSARLPVSSKPRVRTADKVMIMLKLQRVSRLSRS